MVDVGRGDALAKSRRVFMMQALLHGGLPIFGIIYFQQTSVIPLFDALTNGDSNLAKSGSDLLQILRSRAVLDSNRRKFELEPLRWRRGRSRGGSRLA